MRCRLNIPCLRQHGVGPHFDSYVCQLLLLVMIFVGLGCFVLLSWHHHNGPRQTDYRVTSLADGTSRDAWVAGVATDTTHEERNYGVLIDCGSSGSRVYIYSWLPHTGGHDKLLDIQPVRDLNGKPYIKKIEPGIASFADKPSSAAEYLRTLLDFAAKAVPKSKHKESPLYIYATAGLRILPERDQELILSDIRTDIPLWFDFLFVESHTEVISGRQEAIYAWVSINYAMGKFDRTVNEGDLALVDVPGHDTDVVRKQTVGLVDMGGGSLQVAFEVPHSLTFELPKDEAAKSLVTEFGLGYTKSDKEHIYRLYTTTYLNFGSNSARKQYEQAFFNSSVVPTNSSHVGSPLVQDPCLPVKFREQISSSNGDQMLTLEGTGSFLDCYNRLKYTLLNQSATCMKEPCSLNGMFQPEIDFERSKFYGFSEFFYTMEDVLHIGGSYDYHHFVTKAKEFCGHSWETLENWQDKHIHPRADHNRYRLQCFKSAWILLILHEGLGFPTHYEHLTSIQYIQGEEIHWTLGALVYKTKYYPLRDIEKHDVHNYSPPWRPIYRSNSLVIMCVVVVTAAILVYVWRLRPWRSTEIRRVPTMSYFMTEEGQIHEGLMSVEGYSTPPPTTGNNRYFSSFS